MNINDLVPYNCYERVVVDLKFRFVYINKIESIIHNVMIISYSAGFYGEIREWWFTDDNGTFKEIYNDEAVQFAKMLTL
jgi:hypothetical protein